MEMGRLEEKKMPALRQAALEYPRQITDWKFISILCIGMFSRKNKLSNLVIKFYYVRDTMYMYSSIFFDKILTHFVDAT